MDDEVFKNSQRRASLTYPKALGSKDCFHNRSLQDFSNRVKVDVESELEDCRQKSCSSESVSSDTSKCEWRQVRVHQLKLTVSKQLYFRLRLLSLTQRTASCEAI